VWIFAYGSLIFRPSFSFAERRRAFVRDWARRFWQGSPDHRGVPEAPGRVATLVPLAGEVVGGCAYRVDENADRILAELDVREQAGFERVHLPMREHANAAPFAEGITWIAHAGNAHFLGPLSEPEIAAYVRARRGPSGENADYVLRLAAAIRELDIDDAHVYEVARHLEQAANPRSRGDLAG
jgi:cation transport regulator ChaC